MTKILVVEDDKFLANAYRLKLTKASFDIRIAGDGQEALGILQNFKPEVILLDLVMPVKDGFATLAELKANENWKSIPVIVASNLGQEEDIAKSKNLGAEDYIVKRNTSLDDLVSKINSLVGK